MEKAYDGFLLFLIGVVVGFGSAVLINTNFFGGIVGLRWIDLLIVTGFYIGMGILFVIWKRIAFQI